jgi:opacity protein-like surface antigen
MMRHAKELLAMRRAIKALVLTAAVAFVCAPAQARADGYVSPWAGVNFGYNNDLLRTCSGDCGASKSWGVSAGWMGAGIIGGEVEFGWSPDVYGTIVDNHVWDLMGNVIVGIPIGGQHGAGVRPYVTGGLGAIHTKIVGGSAASSLDNTDFGYNFGAGVNSYFSDHFGIRGDVRYLRTANATFNTTNASVGQGQFHFTRASIGLVIR